MISNKVGRLRVAMAAALEDLKDQVRARSIMENIYLITKSQHDLMRHNNPSL